MSYSEQIRNRYAKALMGNYGLPPVAIREGEAAPSPTSTATPTST